MKQVRGGAIRYSHYCRCGSSFRVTASRGDEARLQAVITIWEAAHSGEGHRTTDARGAAKAREVEHRRIERATKGL